MKEIEVVARLTAEEARDLFVNDRAEFDRRTTILVKRAVTSVVINKIDRDYRTQHRDDLISEGYLALADCLAVIDTNAQVLENWPGYVVTAAVNRCRKYLHEMSREINWVVKEPRPATLRSNRIAPGSPQDCRLRHNCEGRGEGDSPRLDWFAGYDELDTRTRDILELLVQGFSQAEIAKQFGLSVPRVSEIVAAAKTHLRDA